MGIFTETVIGPVRVDYERNHRARKVHSIVTLGESLHKVPHRNGHYAGKGRKDNSAPNSQTKGRKTAPVSTCDPNKLRTPAERELGLHRLTRTLGVLSAVFYLSCWILQSFTVTDTLKETCNKQQQHQQVNHWTQKPNRSNATDPSAFSPFKFRAETETAQYSALVIVLRNHNVHSRKCKKLSPRALLPPLLGKLVHKVLFFPRGPYECTHSEQRNSHKDMTFAKISNAFPAI